MHCSSVMVSLYFLKVLVKEFFTLLYRLAALSCCLIKGWGTVSIRVLWRLFDSLFSKILMHVTHGLLILVLLIYWWVQGWAHLASICSSGVDRGIWLKSALRSITMWGFLSAVKTRRTLLMMNSIHRQWK